MLTILLVDDEPAILDIAMFFFEKVRIHLCSYGVIRKGGAHPARAPEVRCDRLGLRDAGDEWDPVPA